MDTLHESLPTPKSFDLVDATFINRLLNKRPCFVTKKEFEPNEFRQIYQARTSRGLVEGYVYSFGGQRVFVDRNYKNLSCWSEILYAE